MQDINAPESLRDFQISYGRYLRNPEVNTLPVGVPERRSEIYEDLLFNNISGFIDNCFPVSHSLFEEAQWEKMRRAFFDEWRCTTPIFSQIPKEFVRFISERPIGETLPPWLPELLHYEWMELEVDLDESELDDEELKCAEKPVVLNPSLRLLAYQWPVHTISAQNQPAEYRQTCLAIYRDKELKVRFSELNATTFMLLQFIQQHDEQHLTSSELRGSIEDVLVLFAGSIQHPEPETLVKFGVGLIEDLRKKKILLGDLTGISE